MKKVSIIVPTYKRSNTIINIVNNVLRQDYPNFEIIIIDDNGIGKPEQKKTLSSLKPLLEKNDNIRYIPHKQNLGACSARNTGINESKGDYIAFLDDDDNWHPSFITNMITTAYQKNVDIIYSNFFRIDESGIYYNKNEKNYFGKIQTELFSGWCPATTSLFFIKKEVLLENGGFDKKLKNLEEYDLWLRLSEKKEFAFCNKRLVLKSETDHEQLTNNYASRIEAWIELKKLWDNRFVSSELKEQFIKTIDCNIKNDLYHKDLQHISSISIPKKSKYGLKRTSILIIAKIIGIKTIIKIKRKISKVTGNIIYLPKQDELKIKHEFNIA